MRKQNFTEKDRNGRGQSARKENFACESCRIIMDGDLADVKIKIKIWGNATPDIPRGHLASSGDCHHILIYLPLIPLPSRVFSFYLFPDLPSPCRSFFLDYIFFLLFLRLTSSSYLFLSSYFGGLFSVLLFGFDLGVPGAPPRYPF